MKTYFYPYATGLLPSVIVVCLYGMYFG